MRGYRKIYSDHYGFKFGSEYAIHHIDGNRKNNDIKNLLLLPSKLHNRYHFYKNVIDSWDKDTSISSLYQDVYLMGAMEEFTKICEECFVYYRMKVSFDMGIPPEAFGFERK